MLPSIMITCAARDAVRATTLASCAAVGIRPVVFRRDDLPIGYLNLVATQTMALRFAVQRDWPHVLVLEDDVEASTLWPVRESALVASCVGVVACYRPGLHGYPARVRRAIEHEEPMAPRVVDGVAARTLWGAQALILSRAAAVAALDAIERSRHALDTALQLVLRDRPRDWWRIAVPNLFRHTRDERGQSVWSSRGHPHQTRCYA